MGAVRTTLLVFAIVAMLPSPPEEEVAGGFGAKNARPATYAGAAIGDVFNLDPICTGREGVCKTAGYLIGRLEAKARYNFDLLYAWARSEYAGGGPAPFANQAQSDPIATGTISRFSQWMQPEQNTLRLDDLIPAWRGPQDTTSG